MTLDFAAFGCGFKTFTKRSSRAGTYSCFLLWRFLNFEIDFKYIALETKDDSSLLYTSILLTPFSPLSNGIRSLEKLVLP